MKLETFFPYRLAIAAEGFSRSLSEIYGSDHGLSREEWRLLFLIAGVETIDSLELSRRTTLDKVQVSRASQRLADKGLITRSTAQKDRRLKDFSITEVGKNLFDLLKPKVDERAASILNAMSEQDREALAQGIEALILATRNAMENQSDSEKASR